MYFPNHSFLVFVTTTEAKTCYYYYELSYNFQTFCKQKHIVTALWFLTTLKNMHKLKGGQQDSWLWKGESFKYEKSCEGLWMPQTVILSCILILCIICNKNIHWRQSALNGAGAIQGGDFLPHFIL